MRMLRYLMLFILLSGAGSFIMGQDSVRQRIVLVGDAGELTNGKNPQLELLQSLYDMNDARNCLIYLGDNIYPAGLPAVGSKNYEEKRNILQTQLNVVRGKAAQAIMIPGNHDWKQGKKDGWAQVKHESDYVQSLQEGNVHFMPKDGCPGPVEVQLSTNTVLVIVDTQWWLHLNDKPGYASDCDCKTTDDLLASLEDIVYRNRNKLLLFASHHPFKTYGKHGGYFTLKQHIFPLTEINPALYVPLPVIGSIYPLARGVFGNIQDTRNPIYKKMIQSIDDILKTHPYCIRVSGHDHNLQLIRQNDQNYIVSGGGAKNSQVSLRGSAIFASSQSGFSIIEILTTGKIWVKFFSATALPVGQPMFATALKTFTPVNDTGNAVSVSKLSDSVTAAGATYFGANGLQGFLLGRNYRREWQQAVKVPVIDLSREQGGLKVLQRGGGKQSKSLRLEDGNGKQYVLRSVEKFPDKALQEELRETFVKDLVKDGISASYPYAGVSIPTLAQAAGVQHANPRLVFVPSDPRLGIYMKDFKDLLASFEEREPGNFDKTYSTDKLYEKLEADNDNRVDQAAVLKARLLDMFIMDFDRHEDQWRWGTGGKGNDKVFVPIPRDRDQAFFTNTGLFPYLISRPWLVPQLQGFRAHAKNINRFNFVARNFDRAFLTSLSRKEWEEAARQFVTQMTDPVIEAAIKQQPPAIFQYHGDKIIRTLKERRSYFVQEALRYYRFLAREVTVTGSNHKELFDISRNADGSVQVAVYKIAKDTIVASKIFDRTFFPAETREIRLFGMGGDDEFQEHGEGRSTIRIRLIGGPGADLFENVAGTSARKPIVYDLKTEGNRFLGTMTKKLSVSPSVNDLNRRGFKYDMLIPFVSASYNVDDGLYLGGSLKYITQGFRKDPFKVMHQLVVNHSLATKAYNFAYKMEAIDAIGKVDLLLNAGIKAPNNTINFFRFGNESVYSKGKAGGIRYYRARFNLGDVSLLARVNPVEHLAIAAGGFLQYYNMERETNRNRLISFPSLTGLDSSTLFKRKMYAGVQLSAFVDTRDNKITPGRGLNWQTTLRLNKGLENYTGRFTQLSSELSMFMSFSEPAIFVVAQRFGTGINFGKYEFFQAQFLSGTENLRGFRKYRFAGDKVLYSNTELRVKLADLNTYILPSALGLLAFLDAGRVWVHQESSDKIHAGYGGGIWLCPLKKFVVTASYAASEEGGLPMVSFGFQF